MTARGEDGGGFRVFLIGFKSSPIYLKISSILSLLVLIGVLGAFYTPPNIPFLARFIIVVSNLVTGGTIGCGLSCRYAVCS